MTTTKDSPLLKKAADFSNDLDQDALIARARAGDRAALDAVIGALEPVVRRYAMILCRTPDDAEEVAQDSLILVTRAIGSFDGRASLSTWAWPITRTACNRRFRRKREQLIDDETIERTDDAPRADELAEVEERVMAVRRAVARLPEPYRTVIELRDVDGLSGDEAAARQGLSLTALKSRLHRARGMLRDELEREFGGPSPDTYCVDVARMLSSRLEGDLTPADCERFEAHVRECPSCGPACDRLREALALCARPTQSGPKRATTK